MSSPTLYKVPALVVGLPTVAGVQQITVQTQITPTACRPPDPSVVLPNAHPHRMLGGIQLERYYIFLDVEAHLRQLDDCTYVLVKIHRWTREPLNVDSRQRHH